MHGRSENSNPHRQPLRILRRLAGACGLSTVVLGTLLSSGGCFNADALIEAQRAVAMRTRLEEVDLGKFRVTLPHAEDRAENAELHFHVFGQVANGDLKKAEAAIDENGPDIRHRMLIATRLMTTAQLEDPQLKDLRESFVKVVNETLKGKPVKSIGFYRFSYSSR